MNGAVGGDPFITQDPIPMSGKKPTAKPVDQLDADIATAEKAAADNATRITRTLTSREVAALKAFAERNAASRGLMQADPIDAAVEAIAARLS